MHVAISVLSMKSVVAGHDMSMGQDGIIQAHISNALEPWWSPFGGVSHSESPAVDEATCD